MDAKERQGRFCRATKQSGEKHGDEHWSDGIDASQFQLDVTANNVANAASYGFKRSRSEFADIYSSGVYQKIDLTVGKGTRTVAASQQFAQGSTKKTTSVLDMAIQGSGYFVTSPALEVKDFKYTRAGAYKLNKDNYIVNSHDEYLMAYPVNKQGNSVTVDDDHAGRASAHRDGLTGAHSKLRSGFKPACDHRQPRNASKSQNLIRTMKPPTTSRPPRWSMTR